MGREFFDVPLIEGLYENCSTESFIHYVSLLSEKRRTAAYEAQKKALETMSQPVAIFRSEHHGYCSRKYRLCTICELSDLRKTMAKLVAKSIHGNKCHISVHAKDKSYAKRIKKTLKKVDKKAKVNFYGRSAKDNIAVLVGSI